MQKKWFLGIGRLGCFLSLLTGSGLAMADEKAPLPEGFDAYVEKLQEDWSIPGVAVAVVQGDKVTVAKGYGLRQWDRPEPVTEDTLFGIASITKTFVAGAIATLVDQGKLGWDDPIVKHLPDFKLEDPWITKNVTVRDFLSHRSGIASYGDVWEELPGLTEKEAVRRFRYLGQSMPFRSAAQYSTLTYIVLGQIIEKLTGQHWSDYIRHALWDPMGAPGAYAQVDEFVPARNIVPTGDGWSETVALGFDAVDASIDIATPHVRWEAFYDDRFSYDDREFDNTISHFHSSVIDAGQSVFASIDTMAKWANLLLNDGRLDGKQIIAAETVTAMRQLNSIVKNGAWFTDHLNGQPAAEIEAGFKRRQNAGFGLGLQLFLYQGHSLSGHSGGELGYGSLMVIDNEKQFAAVILVNNSLRSYNAPDTLMNMILDWHYGHPARDWSDYYMKRSIWQQGEYTARFHGYLDSAEQDTSPSQPLADYAGIYHNPIVGDIEILLKDGRLMMTTGEAYELEVGHWQNDTFRGTMISPLRFNAMLDFGSFADGRPQTLHVRYLEIRDIDLEFRRKR